jgi:hypothetical protein
MASHEGIQEVGMSTEEQPLTPKGMLDDFRKFSDPWLSDQARQFMLMAPSCQRELLFWMIMNNGIAMEQLKGALTNVAGRSHVTEPAN